MKFIFVPSTGLEPAQAVFEAPFMSDKMIKVESTCSKPSVQVVLILISLSNNIEDKGRASNGMLHWLLKMIFSRS